MSETEKSWRWLLAIAAVVGLLTAACGDDNDDGPGEGSESTVTSDVTDPEEDDDAVTSGQCAEDAPDCEDTVVDDVEGPDTSGPQTSDGGGEIDSSTGVTVNGGLSVSEVLASEAALTGVIAVKGHVYDEGAGTALCETLTGGGERYTCGGPLLPVEGLDLESMRDDVIIHDGLTYTEVVITVFGEIVDNTLVVDPNTS